MNTQERRIAASMLQAHYGKPWVFDYPKSPHIMVYTPFDNDPAAVVFQKSIGKVDVVISGRHHIRPENGREIAKLIINKLFPGGWSDD